MLKHIDLFSGIGGFSLALDKTFHEEKIEHTFVEYDLFCQEVLKKHWPEAEIHGDIKQFIADAKRLRRLHLGTKINSAERPHQTLSEARTDIQPPFLLTGGFPCQPFSQAGRRKGTADDRYLWPAMLECITLFRPEWVIAENVGGLASWNEGLVLETVCADLENEGYKVQPIIIPAVAVGAPHRRDRIWFIAHSNERASRSGNGTKPVQAKQPESGTNNTDERNAPDTAREPIQGNKSGFQTAGHSGFSDRAGCSQRPDWNQHWHEVAARLCRVDDGIPRRMDRSSRLKALGNAICPQVAEEILKGIKARHS